jgi:hypothetical protein
VLGLALVALHLLALGVLWLLPLQLGWRLALSLACLLSLGYSLWARVMGWAPWSLREAIWSDKGWRLRFRDGRVREALLLPSTLIMPRLVILNFRVGWLSQHHLILTEVLIAPELLRRLRARLRLQRLSA